MAGQPGVRLVATCAEELLRACKSSLPAWWGTWGVGWWLLRLTECQLASPGPAHAGESPGRHPTQRPAPNTISHHRDIPAAPATLSAHPRVSCMLLTSSSRHGSLRRAQGRLPDTTASTVVVLSPPAPNQAPLPQIYCYSAPSARRLPSLLVSWALGAPQLGMAGTVPSWQSLTAP
jgi:hypothetical protein